MKQLFLRTLASLAILGAFGAGAAHAACNASVDGFTLDWSNVTWSNGTRSRTLSVPRDDSSQSINVGFAFTGSTARFLSGWPRVSNDFPGPAGFGQRSLGWAVDFTGNTQDVTLTITFPEPVEDLSFQMTDVDSLPDNNGNGGFRDGIELTATGPTGTVPPTFQRSVESGIYLGNPLPNNVAVAVGGNLSGDSIDATLFVSYPAKVSRVTIRYTNGYYPQQANPDPQGIGIHDLDFCIARVPDIAATKTQRVFSETPVGCAEFPGTPDPLAEIAIPGACVEYTIRAQNNGTGPATSLTLTDVLNPNLIFVGATSSGFTSSGPGFGLSTPGAMQNCTGGACTIALNNATLAPGQSGEIIIRTLLK
jgi:uncharacterized repeat protein (TIGR01451 family)